MCIMFPFFQWTLVIRNHAVHPSGTMVIQLEYHCLTICCSNFRTTLAKLSAEARGHQPAYGQHVAMLLMDTHFHLKGISDVYWYPKLLYECLRAACFRHIIIILWLYLSNTLLIYQWQQLCKMYQLVYAGAGARVDSAVWCKCQLFLSRI